MRRLYKKHRYAFDAFVVFITCIVLMVALCGCANKKTYYNAKATHKVEIFTHLPKYEDIVKEELKPFFYTCGPHVCIDKKNALKLFILSQKIRHAYNYALEVYNNDIKALQKVANL